MSILCCAGMAAFSSDRCIHEYAARYASKSCPRACLFVFSWVLLGLSWAVDGVAPDRIPCHSHPLSKGFGT